MMNLILEHIWLIVFVLWGIPLGIYRSRFRKMVYQTESWTINIKPLFMKEIRALFGNLFPENRQYLRFRNFYRFYLAVYVLLFLGYQLSGCKSGQMAQNSLAIGSKVPSFALPDQNGKMFYLDSVLGRKNLVVYFYPKDDSPGCTKQACSFRDQFEVFRSVDAEIIGISSDGVESHKEFAEKYRLSYTLLADTVNQVRKLFGVPANVFGLIDGRVTYIINKKGIIIHTFNSQSEASKHVDEALNALRKEK